MGSRHLPRNASGSPIDREGHHMSMKPGKCILQTMVVTLLLLGIDVQASGVNGITGGMPNRISMNVTVPK